MSRTHPTVPRIISFGGGKGGVGKSIIAGNVAVALAETGRRVLLVDADLGAANQHTLFGVDRPAATLADFLDRRLGSLEEAATDTQVPNLRLVVGTGALPNAANIPHAQKLKLMRHVRGTAADVVIIDVGAGSAHNTVDFFDMGDARVLVATAQLTSIQNAYGFLKAAVLRMFRNACLNAEEVQALEAATSRKETQRIREVLAALAAGEPQLCSRLAAALEAFDVRLVGNLVSEDQDVGIFKGVARMVRDFLGVPLPLLGYLSHARDIHDSVNRRAPFLRTAGPSANTRAVRAIAAELMLQLPLATAPSGSAQSSGTSGLTSNSADVSQWLRRHPRLTVNWAAALERAGRIVSVRVVDVSAGGVGILGRASLQDGERFNLILNHQQLSLTVPTVVRNAGVGTGRVGLAFLADEEVALRIMKAAAAERPAGERDDRSPTGDDTGQ